MTNKTFQEKQPTLEEWRRLYRAARAFKNLAPWQWMSEAHLFGIKTPDFPETGYCSIQGALGKHFALSTYRGARGLAGLGAVMRRQDHDLSMLIVTDMLMASFEDKDCLERQDFAIIKKLGLSFSGSKAWPLFRSYRPNYGPWYLTSPEARFLTDALRQAVDISKETRHNPYFLLAPKKRQTFLRAKNNNKWQDSWDTHRRTRAKQASSNAPQPPDAKTIEKLRQVGHCPLEMEVDLFSALNFGLVAGKKGERPYIPYMLLAAESQSGFIIGNDLGCYEEMYRTLPAALARMLLKSPMLIPRRLLVNHDVIAKNLQSLAEPLNITIKKVNRLPAIAQAQRELRRI